MSRSATDQMLAIFGLVLLGLSGCSDGETVPLIPPSYTCERPLDHTWYDLNNICEELSPRAVVWPEGRMPVVVGDRGLLVECDSYSHWYRKDSGVVDDLLVAAVNEDGHVVAAGRNGAVIVGRNDSWESVNPGTETTWRDVRTRGREVWLAGDSGSLAVGIPGESWSMVDFPDTTDLLGVCAFEDSVYVAGAGGMLKVLTGGQWLDMASPLGEEWDLHSIVRLDDGRLVVHVAFAVYIREPDGWNQLEEELYLTFKNHMESRDGYLWIPRYSSLFRFDFSTSPLEYEEFDGEAATGFGLGPDDHVFRASKEGEFEWQIPTDDGGVEYLPDPSGTINAQKLTRLKDGTVVIPFRQGLFRVTPDGLVLVLGLSQEIRAMLHDWSRFAGQSLADFYLGSSSLIHCLNGEIASTRDYPDGMGSVRSMVVGADGLVCCSMSDAILFLQENQWEIFPHDNTPRLFLTNHETVVAAYRGYSLYKTDAGMIPIKMNERAVLVSETKPGILDFVDDDFEWLWWEIGSGATGSEYLNPIPGCDGIYAMAGCETPSGVLFATNRHSMVLKMPEDMLRSDWELVAGPCMRQIELLEVLEDGHLVAVDSDNNYVMIHPPSGF